MRVAGGQIENAVGDLDGNIERIREAMAWAESQHADVLLLPELVLTGYPLEDLAVRRDFVRATQDALSTLARESGRTTTVLGTLDGVAPRRSWDTRPRDIAIGAAMICDGELRGVYHKVLLPNYEVFDEARNFAPGTEPDAVWRVGEVIVGVTICEDSWSSDGPPEAQAAAGAQVHLSQNASPYEMDKADRRQEHCSRLARRNGVPVVYVNAVGGQDELVFDGGSLVVGADGDVIHRAPQFESSLFCVDIDTPPQRTTPSSPRTVHARPEATNLPALPEPSLTPALEELEQVWEALVLGTRDFVRRNGANDAVLGISGGIDSAVTAAVATDALGPDNVLAVSLPVSGTPQDELDDASLLTDHLGISLETLPADDLIAATSSGIARILERRPAGTVRRDLLARMRGAVLLGMAEQVGSVALATVNKTELSLGSSTLYGDMAGDFAPLKDCPKSLLYRLARQRNSVRLVIPEKIIERTPTTLLGDELALHSFNLVDPILARRLEKGEELEDLIAAGFDPEVVRGVLQMIDNAEQQRRQSPPGVKITRRAFGKDRRLPITSDWQPFVREEELLAPGASTATGGPVTSR